MEVSTHLCASDDQLKLTVRSLLTACSRTQVVQSRAAFVTGQEVLEHLLALKPELDTIKAAHDDRRLRFRQMKDDGIKTEPEEREKTWGGRDPQDGLCSIVDEVSPSPIRLQLTLRT